MIRGSANVSTNARNKMIINSIIFYALTHYLYSNALQ